MGIMNVRDRIRGFTMVELLIVIMVISALAAIAIPAAFKVREQGRRVKALAEVKAIALAIEKFYEEYSTLPIAGRFIADTQLTLMQVAPALTGTNLSMNPRGIAFLEFDTKNNPEYLDPWDEHYRIRLDWNYNGYVAPFTSNNLRHDTPEQGGIRALAVVGSAGQDREFGTAMDITSVHTVD